MRRLVTILSATIMLVFSGCAVSADSGVTVKKLRCEYRVNPLGIDVVKPRLCWILESNQRGQMQSAYQVLVASSEERLKRNKGDLWNSGKVKSDQSIHIAYKGKELTSRMRCYWKVRVWDKDDKVSAWSGPALWTMGLLQAKDRQAKWIGYDAPAPPSCLISKDAGGYGSQRASHKRALLSESGSSGGNSKSIPIIKSNGHVSGLSRTMKGHFL